MEIKKINFPKKGETHIKVFFDSVQQGVRVKYGTVFLAAGTRFPEEEFTGHPEIEISYIVKGKMEILLPGTLEKNFIEAGQAIYVAPGELHAANVLKDTLLIYVLTEKEMAK